MMQIMLKMQPDNHTHCQSTYSTCQSKTISIYSILSCNLEYTMGGWGITYCFRFSEGYGGEAGLIVDDAAWLVTINVQWRPSIWRWPLTGRKGT